MKVEDFFENKKGITVDSAFSLGAKYSAVDMCRFAKEYHEAILNNSCISFTEVAMYQEDGSTSVWTDGLALTSDNDDKCAYRLENGESYTITVSKADESNIKKS